MKHCRNLYFFAYIIGVKRIFFEAFQFIKLLFLLFFSFLSGGQTCVICGKKSLLLPLCKSCRATHFYRRVEAPSFYENRCSICGRPLISTKNTCHCCRESQVLKNTDRAFPLFSYRLWNKELLFLWKIQGIRSLSAFYASLYALALKKLSVKYLVPVPPRPGKIRKNGWDQIDELCTFLSLRYGFVLLKLLERKSDIQQKKLGRQERFQKSSLSYFMKSQGEVEKEIEKSGGSFPERVCLVDDVCTTGATIEACAALLKAHAAIKEVYSMTLFIV